VTTAKTSMRKWGFVSQKGGCGKTTLVLQLSVLAVSKGLAVSVLDLDPQRSAEQWSELREARQDVVEPTVVHGDALNLDPMLEAAEETGTDLVLIDTPPAVDRTMIYTAAASDIVIVPTRSNLTDQFSLSDTLDYLERIKALDKAVVILNAPSKDKDARVEIRRIAIEDFGVELLATSLEDQVDFAESLRMGQGIVEAAPRRRSANTIREIFDQLCEFERKITRARGRVKV